MNKHRFRLLIASMISIMLVLSGCSSDGGDNGSVASLTPTTVAGKVTLSSVVSEKARNKALISEAMAAGKPGSKAYQKALAKGLAERSGLDSRAVLFSSNGEAFSNGVVYLYDAGHPEWKYPVAVATTDALGDYTLTVTTNAAKNGNSYTDDAPIPSGNYTLLAFTLKGLFPDLVALQSIVNEFEGTMSSMDLVAQRSTAKPTITSMLGVSKNTDGTQTWGDSSLELAPNAAVQIAFSMPMFREAITDDYLSITADDSSVIPTGTWTLSADWLTATYYLDEGQTWNPGTTYEVKVMGSDGELGVVGAIYNVFGKFLAKTGTGTFSIIELADGQTVADLIDDVSPTATLVSPVNQTGVELIEPIRISSNERMDVNGLLLKATPSLGAQPGVLFVGKVETQVGTATKVTYEYEFALGAPLKLGTTYDITVAGGKDLAGNEMNPLQTSFQTEVASEGITVLDDTATADEIAEVNAQVDVKDVFGKWIRSMNDRNLPQLQSVMKGDFFMEYNAANGYEENDLNRDGVYDLSEFSDMISNAFTFWDYCGVTVTGKIPSDINIVGDTADFEFVLGGESAITNQDCKEAVPQDSLFATLEKINGGWFMSRASEGIDTRGQEISAATLLTLVAPDDGETLLLDDDTSAKFEWEAIDDAASYALIMINSRNAKSGFAVIVPPTKTSLMIPDDIMFLFDKDSTSTTLANVTEDFGFTDGFDPRPGSELYWQVAALGSNTVADVQNDRQTSIPKDVVAMSSLNSFKLDGEYQEISVTVYSNDGALGTEAGVDATDPVKFSELIRGYDLGAANWASIEFTSPRVAADGVDDGNGVYGKGVIFVDGNTHKEYCVDFDATGKAMTSIALNQGVNRIGVSDDASRSGQCNQSAGTAGGDNGGEGSDGGDSLEEWFQITTAGGIESVITIDSVKGVNAEATSTDLVNDGWDFYTGTTDSVKIIVTGSVDCSALDCAKMHDMNLNLWNDKSHASANSRFNANNDGTFTVELEIYQGENWINIHGGSCDSQGNCQDFNVNFGVKTDAGSIFVPPISDIVMIDAADSAIVAQKENWGNGGMWNASAVTGNIISISGVMEFAADNSGQDRNPRFDVGSDGGWMSEDINVAADGSFSFDVELFHGWNYVNIQDANDNWYHLDVLTDLGKEVIRPEVTLINGSALPATGDVTVAQCNVVIEGTAMPGQMQVYWNGNKADQHFWDEIKTVADADGAFTVTVPLVGSADNTEFTENFVDIFDQNWNWMGTRIINTAECNYEAPTMTVTSVTNANDTALVELNNWDNGADYGVAVNDYSPVPTTSVSITGTSNVAGRTITAELYGCGGVERYSVQAASAGAAPYAWTISGVTVYEGYNGVNVTNGPQWYNVNVNATNDNPVPPPAISVTIAGATSMDGPDDQLNCNYSEWNAGTASMITISGTTTSSVGKGEYHMDGSFGTFDIVAGTETNAAGVTLNTFTIADIPLYNGSNHININDSDWNHHGMNIQSTNATQRPQFVSIDTMNGEAFDPTMMPAGQVTITGTIFRDPDGNSSFLPSNVGAGVDLGCDPNNGCKWAEYSSDPNADWAEPLELVGPDESGNYTFSFDVTFPEDINNTGKADRGWINVWSDQFDSTGMWIEGHGMDTPINDANCHECGRSWKPGKASKPEMSLQNRNRVKAARSKGK